jgi:hypothetical protein
MSARQPLDFHPYFPRYIREGDLDATLTLYEDEAVFRLLIGDPFTVATAGA